MESGKVLLGVLAGVAGGALLGILFAPEKGSRTRKKIMRKGEDYADIIKDKVDELVETITDKYEDLKGETESISAKGKAKYDGIAKEIKHSHS